MISLATPGAVGEKEEAPTRLLITSVASDTVGFYEEITNRSSKEMERGRERERERDSARG